MLHRSRDTSTREMHARAIVLQAGILLSLDGPAIHGPPRCRLETRAPHPQVGT
jgi:hypothetical protein